MKTEEEIRGNLTEIREKMKELLGKDRIDWEEWKVLFACGASEKTLQWILGESEE